MRLSTRATLPGSTPAGFQLGQVVATPRALEELKVAGQTLEEMLSRHQSGDWGEISAAQRDLNSQGLITERNVISTYTLTTGERLTVFTRGDRTHTLVHLAPRA